MLSRREFLRTGIGLGLMASGIGSLENILSPSYAQSRRITFEEARADINLRQGYFDRLVKEEFGEEASSFVDGFVYDHSTNLARNYEAQTRFESTEKMIINKLVEKSLPKVLNDHRFRDSDKSQLKKQLEAEVREIFRSSPAYSRLKERAYQESKNAEEFEQGKAITLPTSYLEKRPKSRIFVFKPMFEDTVTILGKYPATEEGFKSNLRHEYRHAKQKIIGIKLSNGVHLIPEYLSRLNPKIRKFARETEAYIQEVDNTLKLGTSHPAYNEAVAVFKQHLFKSAIDPRQYGSEERKVIGYMNDEISRAMTRHISVKPFTF
ncbi:hypothetical protein HYT53_01665 [Candidatus Woesearchaeota archaeon]|nr:hypothetical protein [Candidatus Woesearchaeota archaeon]